MDVTIIGAGNMGRGIGARLASGGHSLTILDTDPDQASGLAAELDGGRGAASGAGADEPLEDEVVVVALPYAAAESAVRERADELDGKTVVDITNPVDFETFDGLVTPADSSAAEELAKLAPGARVVKAFNTTFAGTLERGEVAGQRLDVFIAGDDEGAKETVAEIVRSSGLNPIDAGPLRRAHALEQMGFLHMSLQDSLGTGFGSTIKVLS